MHDLKVHGPISQNGYKLFVQNDTSSPKKSWFKILLHQTDHLGYKKRLRTAIAYLTV